MNKMVVGMSSLAVMAVGGIGGFFYVSGESNKEAKEQFDRAIQAYGMEEVIRYESISHGLLSGVTSLEGVTITNCKEDLPIKTVEFTVDAAEDGGVDQFILRVQGADLNSRFLDACKPAIKDELGLSNSIQGMHTNVLSFFGYSDVVVDGGLEAEFSESDASITLSFNAYDVLSAKQKLELTGLNEAQQKVLRGMTSGRKTLIALLVGGPAAYAKYGSHIFRNKSSGFVGISSDESNFQEMMRRYGGSGKLVRDGFSQEAISSIRVISAEIDLKNSGGGDAWVYAWADHVGLPFEDIVSARQMLAQSVVHSIIPSKELAEKGAEKVESFLDGGSLEVSFNPKVSVPLLGLLNQGEDLSSTIDID